MNLNEVKKALPHLFKNKVTGMLIGTHGVGKSTAIREYTEENNIGFIDLRLGQMEVGDLLGLPEISEAPDGAKVTSFARPSWFPTSGAGVLFLDEINRSKRDVIQAVFQLVLERKLHNYELPPEWHIVAAMNPSTDDYTTLDMSDKAFNDRFCHIKIQSTYQDFLAYGQSKNFNPNVLQFISNHPGMLRGANNQDFDLKMVEPSDRSWHAVARLSDDKEIPENLLNELVSGIVGTEAATAFMAWKKNAEKPIDATEVLKSYKKVKDRVLEQASEKNYRPDLLNETMVGLIAHCQTLSDETKTLLSKKEYDNVIAFAMDLPNDLYVKFFKDMIMPNSDKRIPISLIKQFAEDKTMNDKIEACKAAKTKAG